MAMKTSINPSADDTKMLSSHVTFILKERNRLMFTYSHKQPLASLVFLCDRRASMRAGIIRTSAFSVLSLSIFLDMNKQRQHV
jgi:hypothetical protein